MKSKAVKQMFAGIIFILAFILWTVFILTVDVQPVGVQGTDIGFATVNSWFHSLTGVNMLMYYATDWLGIVPVFVCMLFGITGVLQLVKRRSLRKVDPDLIISGIYYIIVIFCYLVFEIYPLNYRPVLINGVMEASYPSSTTLLVLCVMPTLVLLSSHRISKSKIKMIIKVLTTLFSVFMVSGRLISGVHWLSDIVASALLSGGLYFLYTAAILLSYRTKQRG